MALVVKNLQAFEEFRRRIASVVPELLPKLANRIGVAFVKEVGNQFRESRDPYGNAWAPVFRDRKRDRRARARRQAKGLPPRADKPLIDTGRLRASATARVEGDSVRVALPVEYASYHQYGTRAIQRRQILPEGSTGGLGPHWGGAATKEATALLKEHFTKRGG